MCQASTIYPDYRICRRWARSEANQGKYPNKKRNRFDDGTAIVLFRTAENLRQLMKIKKDSKQVSRKPPASPDGKTVPDFVKYLKENKE